MEASGIAFAEQSMRRGRYYEQPKFPFVPGYDLVGRVVATGKGVDTALVGKRVAAMTKTGGWASHVLLSANDLLPVPEDAIASALKGTGNILIPFLKVLVQLGWWNMMPSGRKAYFYNIWDGKGTEPFQAQLRETFTQLTTLLASGTLKPQIAARFPLDQITEAMRLAESRTAYGKVVLVP